MQDFKKNKTRWVHFDLYQLCFEGFKVSKHIISERPEGSFLKNVKEVTSKYVN